MCEKGIELAIKINQAEQELNVATRNYRNTGLARYKQTVMNSEAEFCKVMIELEQHRSSCNRCDVLPSL